ncbi:putative Disease resistance protein RPM1 [Corchorus olitorius]|uniref:Disease resistance protein RPM1 n=1 Tax=Corchorus olitorius TaxID=93759 RepID=A0A1R3IR57_9ROSI|nr:putative Disease resistance protein RPM1 [Corchorus olitorius]
MGEVSKSLCVKSFSRGKALRVYVGYGLFRERKLRVPEGAQRFFVYESNSRERLQFLCVEGARRDRDRSLFFQFSEWESPYPICFSQVYGKDQDGLRANFDHLDID